MYYIRLMLNQLPEFVDPMRLAETGQLLKGQVAVAKMPRLVTMLGLVDLDASWRTEVLPSPALGEVDVDLVFGIDGQGVRHVLGSVRAELGAVCQRCLQPMVLPFQANIALGMARTLDDAECLPGDYEPLMVVDGAVQSLAAIIEDELLLALPPAPMHRIGQCPAWHDTLSDGAAAEDLPPEGKKRPFAVLAELKQLKKKQ